MEKCCSRRLEECTGAWASNFRVLHEVSRRAPDFKPRRILDYGAGPAPGLCAAQEVWPDSFTHATAVEPSEHMTRLALSHVLARAVFGISTENFPSHLKASH